MSSVKEVAIELSLKTASMILLMIGPKYVLKEIVVMKNV